MSRTRPPEVEGRHRGRRGLRAGSVAGVLVLAAATACGGDGEAAVTPGTGGGAASPGPSGGMGMEDLAEASGAAPAARGAGLSRPPGPTARRGLSGTGEVAASVTAADGRVRACCLLVAASEGTRARGLMAVTDLGGYAGMVFVWDGDTASGFWMRDTPMPLSIAFFDAEGRFVASADMSPCGDVPDCPVYPSPGTYRFAVEVPRGELGRLGVGPGSRLRLGGACAPS